MPPETVYEIKVLSGNEDVPAELAFCVWRVR